jgi:sugar (pentulose or hexulose) kinase
MSRYVLALDFGHGGGKALFLDLDSDKRFLAYKGWSYFSPEGDSYRKEFVADEFFDILCNLVKDLVKKHKIKPEDVVGISTACMRHAYVFLDSNGKEVYAGPNTDIRGLFYQDVVEQDVKLDLYKITGQGPALMYMPARLLWFKNEKPEVFEKIHYGLNIGDWLIYRLSGIIATEPSLASATMAFDLEKKTWLSEVLDVLGLNNINLPEIHNAGEQIGELKTDVAKKMNLKPGIPVVIGGGDTHLGLLACSGLYDGDIGVVAGTSTPVMMVLSKPVVDEKKRIWTGCHVLKDKWVLEGNGQMGGLSYQWLKNNFEVLLEKKDQEVYAYMEKLASKVPPGSDDMVASLGAEIFNLNEINIVRPAIFTFQQPGHVMNTSPATFGHFIRATLENVSYAIRGNIEQMEEISNKKSDELKVTGGMSRSTLWLEILSGVTGKKVKAGKVEDGTLLGCAMCAAVGSGIYKDFEEAAKEMVEIKKEISADKEQVEIYNKTYNNWKEWYDRIGSL